MKLIKRIPIPFCGVALGLAAAGNLLQSTFPVLRPVFGIASAVVLVLFLLKLILFFPAVREDLKNPVQASVSGTFCMACMLLSVYIKPLVSIAGEVLWFAAVVLNILLILYFSIRFMKKMKPAEYHASFYIVYVGIATASISAPAWNMQLIGKVIAVFALVAFLLMVIPVTWRYLKGGPVPPAAKPLFVVSAAPASLCIVAIKNAFGASWAIPMILLFILGTVLYVPAVILAIRKAFTTFFPSFAAFTFPLVISAIATTVIRSLLGGMEQTSGMAVLGHVIGGWGIFQQIAAVFMTVRVLIRFLVSFGQTKEL